MLWSSKRLVAYLLFRALLCDVTAVTLPPVSGTEARILHQSRTSQPQSGPREGGPDVVKKTETNPQNCNTTAGSLMEESTSNAGAVTETHTFNPGNGSLSTETSTNISSVTTDVSPTRNRQLTPDGGVIGRQGYMLGKRISIWGVNPVLTVVGFVTNCLSVRVIHDMLRAGTSSMYLLGLAIVDAANCFVGMYLTVTSILEDFGYKSVRDFTTRSYPYAWILVSGSVARLSATFTTILTVERFLAVCFPFYVKRSCFSRYPKIPIALSLLLVPGYFIISVLKYAAVEVTDPETGATWVEITKSDLGREYVEFFHVWTSAGVLITHIVPLVIITILNGCIVGKLIYMRRLRSRMTSSKSTQADKNQVTRILVSLAFLFTLTNIPVVVFLVFMFLDSDFTPRGPERYLYLLLMELNNTLVILNSAANFFVAVIASGNFRMFLKTRYGFRAGQAADKSLHVQTCSTGGTKDVTSSI